MLGRLRSRPRPGTRWVSEDISVAEEAAPGGVSGGVYNRPMDVTDTPPHVRRRLVGIYASMTGAERVAHAVEMAEEAKAIAVAGIRARHPDWTDAAVGVEWLRVLHGDEIADRVARCSSSS